ARQRPVPVAHPRHMQHGKVRGVHRPQREHDARHARGQRRDTRADVGLVEPRMHDVGPARQELAGEVDRERPQHRGHGRQRLACRRIVPQQRQYGGVWCASRHRYGHCRSLDAAPV
ncbi:MAG: hypothetical protein ACK559_30970, partial [bacterium]